MIDYSAADLQQIAKIDVSHHIGLLTNCGIHADNAHKLIAMSDAELADAVAKFAPIPNKTEKQEALVAAARREITIREG